MLKVFLNHLTLGNSSVIEQMEKLYILISLTALFAFSSSLCVTEDEGKDGIDLRCSSRWSGEGSKIRRLIVHSWDGSCHFPEGGLLTLYGADQDCFTCSKSIHERMMVNGEKCTVAVSHTFFFYFKFYDEMLSVKSLKMIFTFYLPRKVHERIQPCMFLCSVSDIKIQCMKPHLFGKFFFLHCLLLELSVYF
jgi:hypothetical protein